MAKDIQPKPTQYRGIKFRSRTEARTAALLDYCSNVMRWVYEPTTFTLSPQNWDYTPDFEIRLWLKGKLAKFYMEVKPAMISQEHSYVLQCMSTVMRGPLIVLVADFYAQVCGMTIFCKGKNKAAPPSEIFNDFSKALAHAAQFRFDLRQR